MSVERNDFVLGVGSDTRAVRAYLQALEVIPAALKTIEKKIQQVDLGQGRKFEGDAKALAQAFISGFRSELGGGQFQSAFRAAMKGVDLRIPPEAQANLRRDLTRLRNEIASALPQQVRVGVRANTNLASLPVPGASAAEQRAANAKRITETRPDAQTKAGRIEDQAGKDDQRRAEQRQRKAQLAGRTEERAYSDDARLAEQRQRKAQLAGRTEERAYGDDAKRAEQRQRQAQQAGRTEERAYGDDAKLAEQEATNARRTAQLRDRAQREMVKDLAGRDPNSRESILSRASASAQDKRIQTQQYLDQNPEVQQLTEAARLRALGRQADREQLRQQGPVGQIKAGLQGFGGGGLLEMTSGIFAGSAIYNLASRVFGVLQSGVQELVQGSIEFEEALANLGVTFNTDKDSLRGFATEVGATANNIGLTQAQGVEAASRSVGLFNTAGYSTPDKEAFAKEAVAVTGRVAQQSGKTDLTQVETALAGTLRGFQLGNGDITRVEDSLAVIAKASGANQGELLDAGAQVALLARQAGFTLQQTTAIIANQATGTAQSPQSVAELLAQVFAQASNPEVQNRLRGVGVDVSNGTTLADWTKTLSDKLANGDITERQLGDLSAAFGRSRSGGAFVNLVEQRRRTDALADKAANSPGEGERQFQDVTNHVGMWIRQFIGSIRGLATELAQSGLLDLFAAMIQPAKKLVEALTEVLKLFNLLPRPLRTTAFGLLELYGILSLLGRVQGLGGLKTVATLLADRAATSRVGGALLSRAGAGRLAADAVDRQAARAAATAAGTATAGAGGSGVAGLVGLLANPYVLAAIAAIGTAVVIKQAVDDTSAARGAESGASYNAEKASTAADLRSSASDFRGAEKLQNNRRDSFLGLGAVVDNLSGRQVLHDAVRDANQAKALDVRAKTVEDGEKKAAKAGGGFGRFNSADDVANALTDLDTQGYSAATQVQLLSQAIDGLRDSANSTSSAYLLPGEGDKFTNDAAAGFTNSIAGGRNRLKGQALKDDKDVYDSPLSRLFDDIGRGQDTTGTFDQGGHYIAAQKERDVEEALGGLDTSKIQTNLSNAFATTLKRRGKDISSSKPLQLTDEDLAALNDVSTKYMQDNVFPALKDLPKDLQEATKKNLLDNAKKTISDAFGKYKPSPNSPEQIKIAGDALFGKLGEAYNQDSKHDRLGAANDRVAAARDFLLKQQSDIGPVHSASQLPALNALGPYERQLQDFVDEQMKARVERDVLLLKVVGGVDPKLKRGVLDAAGRAADEIRALKIKADAPGQDPTDQLANQIAYLEAQQQEAMKDALDRPHSHALARIDPRNNLALANAAVKDAQRRLDYAKKYGDAQAVDDATTARLNAIQAQRQLVLQTNAAKAIATVDPRDKVNLTATQLANTSEALAAALPGTQEYADLQATQTQQALDHAAAQRSLSSAQRHAGIDPRDAVAAARASLQDTKDNLAGALRGSEEYYQLLGEKTQKQLDVANAERAVAASRRLAAVGIGDVVGAAQAAATNAQAELSAAKKGTQAYYDALLQVAQARKAASDALLDRQKNRGLLAIDLTDPVAGAHQATLDAKRRLAAAKGPDDKDKAKLDLRNAQNAEEAAKFQQRLSDVQTADQLGRISHQAYIQYLKSEHDRLSEISKRTRQQQDELNQIDELMKTAADSLNGQFNLGDITLPTVYQVRRAIQEGTGGIHKANVGFAGPSAGQVVNDYSQRALTITGVSLEEVLRQVEVLYGPTRPSVRSAPRRF